MTIFNLHAKHKITNHIFNEYFSSIELLDLYTSKYPQLIIIEITLHEINPT
jgi:hypothetical protein